MTEPATTALTLVEGHTAAERSVAIQNQMEVTRFYLQDPTATMDYNAFSRERARKVWQRKADQASARNVAVEPFDEAEYPPRMHILAPTWDRLARVYDLDVTLTGGGWIEDPGWPGHKAYTVEAIVLLDGRELGRSQGFCSFAEQKGERRRWSDSAHVLNTAETRGRARAIRQALNWAIPFAYHVQTPEEMPAFDDTTTSPETTDAYQRPPHQSASPDLGANSPHIRDGKNINPNFQGNIAGVENPYAPQTAAAPAAPPRAAAPPPVIAAANAAIETTAIPQTDYPLPGTQDAMDLAGENAEFKWAIALYNNAAGAKLLPTLSLMEWNEVVPTLMVASHLPADAQNALVTRMRNKPNPEAADRAQAWLFTFESEETPA